MRIVTDMNLHIALSDKGNIVPRLQIYNGQMKSDFWDLKNILPRLEHLSKRVDEMVAKARTYQQECDRVYLNKNGSGEVFTKQDILDLLGVES